MWQSISACRAGRGTSLISFLCKQFFFCCWLPTTVAPMCYMGKKYRFLEDVPTCLTRCFWHFKCWVNLNLNCSVKLHVRIWFAGCGRHHTHYTGSQIHVEDASWCWRRCANNSNLVYSLHCYQLKFQFGHKVRMNCFILKRFCGHLVIRQNIFSAGLFLLHTNYVVPVLFLNPLAVKLRFYYGITGIPQIVEPLRIL